MIKLQVTTHSGKDAVVDVDEYDPKQLAEDLNNTDIQSIVIGDRIYARIDVKNIWPHKKADSEEKVVEG